MLFASPRRGEMFIERSTALNRSCGAADKVKPKARLCEPWVNAPKVIKPRRGDSDHW